MVSAQKIEANSNVYSVNFRADNDRQPRYTDASRYVNYPQPQPDRFEREQSPKKKIPWLAILSGGASIAIIVSVFAMLKGKGIGKTESELKTIFEDLSKEKKLEDMALPEDLKKLLSKVKTCTDDPKLIKDRGGKSIGSILLYGPPGTGKTTFAKAIAKQYPDAKFASLDVTSLRSEYNSVSERNLNNAIDMICKEAEAHPDKKMFVFIDEIDSVMMVDEGKGNKISNDLLNEFKKGFTEKLGKHENIITIGATNLEIDVEKAVASGSKKLDKPMLDRFSQKIFVGRPNKEQGKLATIEHYKNCEMVEDSLKKDSPALDKVFDILTKKEHESSFRTLNSLYDEAASSIEDKTTKVGLSHFIDAIIGKKTELKLSDAEINSLKALK